MKDIINVVEKFRELILSAEKDIWRTPETGYREIKTSSYLAEKFKSLGYDINLADNITGFYTVIDTGRAGPEVLILGELDAIICPGHKDADPKTGAVHACGHNVQCAALLGIAAALKEPKIINKLCGKIRLCAVPAEELLEIEYRSELKKQGKIKYYGGKSEFLSRGYFDGVDLAFMVHANDNFMVLKGSNGCLAKNIIYKGLAAHAGGSPHAGKNALYAATCGINAVNAIRETFLDSEQVRFHPIITSGGDMVNAIPEQVRIESYVRATTFDAMVRENKKVNQALCGAALSLNNNVEIIDIPGYSPLVNCYDMIKVAEEAASIALPEIKFSYQNRYSAGSTDMGDLSCIMPVVHPYICGVKGKAHGNDYEVYDPETACIGNVKWQLTMLLLLLKDNAKRAKKIIKDFKPLFNSKQEFLDFQDSLNCSGDRIIYKENEVEIKL